MGLDYGTCSRPSKGLGSTGNTYAGALNFLDANLFPGGSPPGLPSQLTTGISLNVRENDMSRPNPNAEDLRGEAVQVFSDGEIRTALLIDKDTPDSYVGVIFYWGSILVDVKGGTMGETIPGFGKRQAEIGFNKVKTGLRRYPASPDGRVDVDFQFVLKGEDVQPLLDIATRNAQGRVNTGPAEAVEDTNPEGADNADMPARPVAKPKTEPATGVVYPPEADKNKDGVTDDREKRKWDKKNPE